MTKESASSARLSAVLTVFFLMANHQSLAQSDEVEEILVTGERSLRSMRIEVEQAEEAVYELFNQAYAGTDYEMVCTREKPAYDPFRAGSNYFPARRCGSRLAIELYEDELAEFGEYQYEELNGGVGVPPDNVYFQARREEHQDELVERVWEMYEENSEYRSSLLNYIELKRNYDAAVEADFEKGNIFTRFFSWLD